MVIALTVANRFVTLSVSLYTVDDDAKLDNDDEFTYQSCRSTQFSEVNSMTMRYTPSIQTPFSRRRPGGINLRTVRAYPPVSLSLSLNAI